MKGVDPSYANHARHLYSGPSRDGYDLERLFGAGEAIQHLMHHPGWSVLMDMLSAERDGIRGKLEGSKPLEHAETSHLLGQLRGIGAAESAANALEAAYRVELEEQQRRHERSAGESAAER